MVSKTFYIDYIKSLNIKKCRNKMNLTVENKCSVQWQSVSIKIVATFQIEAKSFIYIAFYFIRSELFPCECRKLPR